MNNKKALKSEFIYEFLGTYCFLFIGIGGVAALKIGNAVYSQWEISLLWGVAVLLGVCVSSTVSGAHLNPSVTVVLAIFRNFPKHKILPYFIAQFLAAFAAAASVYALYHGLFNVKNLDTASIFSTFPRKELTFFDAFFVEFAITALLVFGIFSFTDENNTLLNKFFPPLLIGLLVAVIGAAFGPLTGFAMNAARDFSPRLFTYIAGWGGDVFTAGTLFPYCFVPLIAPMLGGIFGAFLYNRVSSYVCVHSEND